MEKGVSMHNSGYLLNYFYKMFHQPSGEEEVNKIFSRMKDFDVLEKNSLTF